MGLVLGYKPAIYYATATAVVLIVLTSIFGLKTSIVLFIVLAYAAALPSKVVELLIDESTSELTRMNEQLRQEIVQRRRAEAELQEYQEHLEVLVEARTAELAEANAHLVEEIAERKQIEAALLVRTAELERRNEELDAFAHTVAHDLKSPLTSIIGFSSVLEKRSERMPPVEVGSYLEIITRSGRKMASIIDELLLLASVRKLDEVRREPLDTAQIVAEVQQRLADLIAEYGAEVKTPQAWPQALGHAPWIEEVWVNYISNAIKYGGRPPQIELGSTCNPDGTVSFWVRDNGKGLTPDEQARLFTLFTRLDQIRAKGHGLGLSIVRRILEKLDGTVEVQSEDGQGSTFLFTLPEYPSQHPPHRFS